MVDCAHGEALDLALAGLCPPCNAGQAAGTVIEPLVIYRRATAMYATVCGLDCGRRIHEGDPIVLVGPDHDSAAWCHEQCGEDLL